VVATIDAITKRRIKSVAHHDVRISHIVAFYKIFSDMTNTIKTIAVLELQPCFVGINI